MVVQFFLFIIAIVAFLGTFSEPIVKVLGQPIIPIVLNEADKAARIIMLYHALAVPFLASVVMLILEYCDVREQFKKQIQWTLYLGAMITGIMGITFAYILVKNKIVHGLFIFGLSLAFYAGILLLIAILPTKKFPAYDEENRRPKLFGLDLLNINLFLVTISILISAVIGGIAGANFGEHGLETAFLAESIVRELHLAWSFEYMVISHLHIMLALLDAAVMLLVFRYTNLYGKWLKIAMLLIIPGIIIMSIGAWLVITGWKLAHMVINVGAIFLLMAALILAYKGWKKIAQESLGDSYSQNSLVTKIKTLFIDPVKSGIYFLFVWVNIVVTIPGIYVAINLDTFRLPEYMEIEYAFNVGHWHVLATLTAIIVFLVMVDIFDVQGRLRKLIGWTSLAGGSFAFLFAVFYMFTIQTLYFILIDIGIFIALIGVGIFGLYILKYLITQSGFSEKHI
jgi:hypothetical protein